MKCAPFPRVEATTMQRHMRYGLAALALSASAWVALAQQPAIPEEARKDLLEGNAVLKSAQNVDDYALAESLYQKALALAPAWADAICNLSRAQEGLKKYDDAIASSKKCIQMSTPAQARVEQDHEYELEGLKKVHDAQVLRDRTWTDPVSTLMWTVDDEGHVEDYSSALAYCTNLRLGNYSNWRLPTIYELQALYDPNVNVTISLFGSPTILHIRGTFPSKPDLYGYIWSSSPGSAPNTVTTIVFDNGRNITMPYENTNLIPASAFCVRNSD